MASPPGCCPGSRPDTQTPAQGRAAGLDQKDSGNRPQGLKSGLLPPYWLVPKEPGEALQFSWPLSKFAEFQGPPGALPHSPACLSQVSLTTDSPSSQGSPGSLLHKER